MPPKPFEAGKNAKELGIDVTRKFVVVDAFPLDVVCGFSNGTIVTLVYDDKTALPDFKNESGRSRYLFWFQLAYADEPPKNEQDTKEAYRKCVEDYMDNKLVECLADTKKPKEPYKPQIGDRVSLEGEVAELIDDACLKVEIYGEMFGSTGWRRLRVSIDSLKLLSRSPRKVTRAEVEKLLGGEFELVD